METKANKGILRILEQIYTNMPHEQLVQVAMGIWEWHFEERASRNKAGGKKKAENSHTRKVIAAEVYIALRDKAVKVSAQQLFNALEHRYPNEKWNYHTIRDWIKLMKEVL